MLLGGYSERPGPILGCGLERSAFLCIYLARLERPKGNTMLASPPLFPSPLPMRCPASDHVVNEPREVAYEM